MKPQVTLVGNCQTKALCWYFGQLDQPMDIKWLCMEGFRKTTWGPSNTFMDRDCTTIACPIEGVKRLGSSDYVVYQPMHIKTSENYNYVQIKKHARKGKLISISVFYYEPDDPEQEAFEGMIERAEKFNIDIPAHKIVEKHRDKIFPPYKNHPPAFYFLELIREICMKTGWNYYSEERYIQLLKEKWPFGV